MKLSRSARLGGMALAGALALAACGSDNNSGYSSRARPRAAPARPPPRRRHRHVNGEGSTAQKNAHRRGRRRPSRSHNPNAKVSYNATGSGAGIKSFNGGQVDWAGSDSALKTDPAAGASTSETRRAEALRRQRRLEPPAGRRPDRRRLQPATASTSSCSRRD